MSEITNTKNKNWIITTKEEFTNRIECSRKLIIKDSKWKEKIIDNPDNLKNYILWLLLKSNKIKVPSNIVKTVIYPIPIFFPEGFSPDGNGKNDTYVVNHPLSVKIQIEIFNRWGESIHKSNDYQNDWDGGSAMQGTYFIKYNAIRISTGESIMKGVKAISIRK